MASRSDAELRALVERALRARSRHRAREGADRARVAAPAADPRVFPQRRAELFEGRAISECGWENEAELVEMARANTAAHVARNVASMRQAERLSDSKAAFDSYRHRTFACRTDDDGTLVFEGRLPADQGAVLIQALDRAMDWLMRGGRRARRCTA